MRATRRIRRNPYAASCAGKLRLEEGDFIMANKLTPELIEKAKQAKTAEELAALAKETGVELTAEEANTYFAQLNPKSGELSDDELDCVAGGCGTPTHNGHPIINRNGTCEYWMSENTKQRIPRGGTCYHCWYMAWDDDIEYCWAPERQ